jgi:predicted phosphodiesterase
MRYLILSDIHSNLEALEAVLADSAGLYQQAVCLGDIVGYGADPNEVTAWVRKNCAAAIRGNHDRACTGMTDLRFFNPIAKAAAEWTQRQLTTDHFSYLRELPMGPAVVDGFQLVHGSPANEDSYLVTAEDAWLAFDIVESRTVFFGHTHLQGGFSRSGGSADVQNIEPFGVQSIQDGDKLLINPGSVGQPRDGNWHAAYVIYDAGTGQIEFRRCPYDVDAAQRKIVEAGLPFALAERLGLGL